MLQSLRNTVRERPRDVLLALLIPTAIFIVAFTVAAWHLDEAPDIFVDEILYTRMGIRVAEANNLVWDNGNPLVIHPPLYFLVEAAYWKITGLLNLDTGAQLLSVTDIFRDVYHARGLNVFIAALTAVAFYGIGTRLKKRRLGLLLAVLFLLDPFGLRTNRRAMLETLAGFLMLAGMGIFLLELVRAEKAQHAFRLRRGLLSGALLGLGVLTKDLIFTAPLALALYGVLEWRRQRRDETNSGEDMGSATQHLAAFMAVAVAALASLLFPLWVVLVGNGSRFVDVKWLALQRLAGLARLTGWNRPGISLIELVIQRLGDYGTTYLMLGLGGVATILLYRYGRRSAAGRFLATWGLVLYPFYAFLAVAGGGADQYYYYLLLPALLLAGYAVEVLPQAVEPYMAQSPIALPASRLQGLSVALLLLLFLPYNAARWVLTYDVGRDNGYYQLKAHVEEMVPANEALNASGDRLKFNYFFPERRIAHAATPEEAQKAHIRYFVLAPRDVEARYGRGTPELAAWIVARGERLFSFEGESFGTIYLYRVDYEMEGVAQGDIEALTIAAAQGAPLGSFLLLLGVWGLGLGVVTWLLEPRALPKATQAYASSMETAGAESGGRHG